MVTNVRGSTTLTELPLLQRGEKERNFIGDFPFFNGIVYLIE